MIGTQKKSIQIFLLRLTEGWFLPKMIDMSFDFKACLCAPGSASSCALCSAGSYSDATGWHMRKRWI
jgi:hypothetical protein